ncbi:unnamed protein product [Vitrella brassicaformis CCMP3155]|uniref:NYN domain-containing protein n=1 Tax=Vitrella brassicaformis (strain CCMP3155) TaxID=1169540 RepID=A0A0G4GF98_VITBC|nr:unnamed protein product [Vitrella brassicaformis CCMP3155]|eukprot:CEM28167.1 unnamed protein product [Vitrella brassicaformis CCMP3155]
MTKFHELVEQDVGGRRVEEDENLILQKRYKFKLVTVDVKGKEMECGVCREKTRFIRGQAGGDIEVNNAVLDAAARDDIDAVILLSGDVDFVKTFDAMDKKDPHRRKWKFVAAFLWSASQELMTRADSSCLLKIGRQGQVWADKWRPLRAVGGMCTMVSLGYMRVDKSLLRRPPSERERSDDTDSERERERELESVNERLLVELRPHRPPGKDFWDHLGK